MLDPDEKVSGNGVKILRDSGIEVVENICEKEIRYSLRSYIHHRKTGLPYGIAKIALSLNGCYASKNREQVWISCKKSRDHSKSLMYNVQAVIEGTYTIDNDFEQLNKKQKGPTTKLVYLNRTCNNLSKILEKSPADIIYVGDTHYKNKETMINKEIISVSDKEVISVSENSNKLNLYEICKDLGQRGVLSAVYEGGAILHRSLFDLGLISELWIYTSSKNIDGRDWYNESHLNGYSLELMEKQLIDNDTFSRYKVIPSTEVSNVCKALFDLNEGRPILLSDDADREDEVDLIIGASHATPEIVELFRKNGTGIICAPMTEMRAAQLSLPLLTENNEDINGTNFTLSCDYSNVSTGVSAKDRAKTLNMLSDKSCNYDDLTRPGHIFPLIAQAGYLSLRQGHTEGSVTLCQLAGIEPVASIVEMVSDDGNMMRQSDCVEWMKKIENSGLEKYPRTLISMNDLEKYLMYRNPKLLNESSIADITLDKYGKWKILIFPSLRSEYELSNSAGRSHLIMVHGDIYSKNKTVLTRIHSECFTGDVLGSKQCDCGPQLNTSLKKIFENGSGVIAFPAGHEGRGIGLVSKIKAYRAQKLYSIDTYEANKILGYDEDHRDYDEILSIFNYLRIDNISIMTENREKIEAFKSITTNIIKLDVGSNHINSSYVKVKREKNRIASSHVKEKKETKINEFNTTKVVVTDEMKSKKILILDTAWHHESVNKMVIDIKNTLIDRGLKSSSIYRVTVPGCFDTISKLNMIHHDYDCIICVGFLLLGETDHYQYTSAGVMQGLILTSIKIEKPIINAICNCHNQDQISSKADSSSGTAQSFAISALIQISNSVLRF